MVKVTKSKTLSKTLGTLSIIMAIFFPLAGIVLGIIGLCVQKDGRHHDRDIVLNIIGIILSISVWTISTWIYSLLGQYGF